jgi:DNA-binding CsgD family transcriptional regulator
MMRFKRFIFEQEEETPQYKRGQHGIFGRTKDRLSVLAKHAADPQKSVKEIAGKMNTSEWVVRRLLRNHGEKLGIPPRSHKEIWTPDRVRELNHHLSDPNVSHAEIGKRMGLTGRQIKDATNHPGMKYGANAPKRNRKFTVWQAKNPEEKRWSWPNNKLRKLKNVFTKHKGNKELIAKDMGMDHLDPYTLPQAIKKYGPRIGIDPKQLHTPTQASHRLSTIFRMRRGGMSDVEIGKHFDTSQANIFQQAKRNKDHPEYHPPANPKSRWSEEHYAELAKVASDPKLSHEEIGKRLNPVREKRVVERAVSKHGKRLGIPPRSAENSKKGKWWL